MTRLSPHKSLSTRDLLVSFRRSLVALIPIAEEVGIEWSNSTHDDWERMEDALFKSIVASPIDYAFEGRGFFPIGPYNAELSDFAKSSFLILDHLDRDLMFVRLETLERPFDTAVFRHYNKLSYRLDGDYKRAALAQSKILALARSPGEVREVIFVPVN